MIDCIDYVVYAFRQVFYYLQLLTFDSDVTIYDGLIFLLCITIVSMIFRRMIHVNE